MFGFKFDSEAVNSKPSEYIGEVYLYSGTYMSSGVYPPHSHYNCDYKGYGSWHKFTRDDRDISRDHDGYVCIFDKCFKYDDVLFYEHFLFGEFKKKIEMKYTEKKVKNG